MPLESIMICLDNSEWMRNGDYVPTRLAAQQDAASMLCNHRLNDNPETTVGILTMAGHGVDLLVSPTEQAGKVLAAFAKVKISGSIDVATSIQIAQLALKHRKNKNGKQRIIIFVGGLIPESLEVLQKLGKQLKKNNVALDVISIGEADDNVLKLQELVNATNAGENSHCLVVPAGVSPTSAIQSSPLMPNQPGMTAMGGGTGDDFDMYGGVDPALDPELAMAIRVSQEEARAQEEARLKRAVEQSATSSSSGLAVDAAGHGDEEEDEATLIQRALEISIRDLNAPITNGDVPSAVSLPIHVDMEMDEDDEDLQRALALSVAPSESVASTNFSDPNFINELLNGAETEIQVAVEQISKKSDEDTNNECKDENNKKRKGDDI